MRLNGLVQDVGNTSLRRGIEWEISRLTCSVAGLLAAQRTLEERNRCLFSLSRRDNVTGLYNQRYFVERLEEEFRRARRYTMPLSLLRTWMSSRSSTTGVGIPWGTNCCARSPA
jgi:PleD family two-component response regulator